MAISRDLSGAERRPEVRMAALWAGQSSGVARSRARAACRPCGEVVGHRPQAANYLDSREQEKVMSRFVFSIVPLNRGKEAICTRAAARSLLHSSSVAQRGDMRGSLNATFNIALCTLESSTETRP